MVARTRSEPGVTSSGVLTRRPAAAAWRAIDAVRVMSSYDELVQLADQRAADLQRPTGGAGVVAQLATRGGRGRGSAGR